MSDSSKTPRRSRFLEIALFTFVVAGFLTLGHDFFSEGLRTRAAGQLELLGAACQQYAADDRRGLAPGFWPPVSFENSPFTIDPALLAPYGISDDGLMSASRPRGWLKFPRRKYYYLGYAVWSESGQALPVVDAIRDLGPANLRSRSPLLTRRGFVFPLRTNVTDAIYSEEMRVEIVKHRLEVEQWKASPNPDPDKFPYFAIGHGRGTNESEIVVAFEHPDIYGDGGHVLYLDGHVEFKHFPGVFPMTERFIAALESFEAGE